MRLAKCILYVHVRVVRECVHRDPNSHRVDTDKAMPFIVKKWQEAMCVRSEVQCSEYI